ncbi:hypothetical protein GCM10009716_11120 [Streptomyces sodiiphilus]|uniref:Secreted protein n=1 Tax=Streptomyces sodiiphilus TaxID=226217 RepID=A0ABN2NUZ2_9ACTN
MPAWREQARLLRAAAGTEPGRLRVLGAALAGLVLLFGAVTSWEISVRHSAAHTALESSQPLSADAAAVYRSLADANTSAAAGFLADGEDGAELRARYADDIANASELLTHAAAHSDGSPRAQHHIRVLAEELPVYTGLVEAARANERQGLPLGSAYLRYADTRMQEVLLPAAEALYRLEHSSFHSDTRLAGGRPWLSGGLGVLVLGALGWAQVRHFRRTNRVFSPGLLAAGTATAVLLGWLAGAHLLARSALDEAERTGARSLEVLHEARSEALKARGTENMLLVSRGADNDFEQRFERGMDRLAGRIPDAPGGLLDRAVRLADDEAGRRPLERAVADAAAWRARHAEAIARELAGDHEAAVALVIGEEGSAGLFDRIDENLEQAVEHEQRQFERAAERGRDRLAGLSGGIVVLTLAGMAGVLTGIGRRLSEYR